MDITVIWILVISPLFFTFGWFAGRIDMKVVIKNAKRIPTRLYTAIDSLSDNKSGIARDEIAQVIEQEPQLIDLQLTLGKIYRKRGENDLAIKLHSKLLKSQYLFSQEDKDHVRLELAQDFQKAGLIDRAEELLNKLENSEIYANQARQMLLLIYQQDKNWQGAINLAQKVANSEFSLHVEIAQFYCELAQQSIIKSHNKEAFIYLEKALELNRKCVRANILLGDLHYSQEEYGYAITAWQEIEKQNHNYIPSVVEKLFKAYVKLDKVNEGLTLFKGYSQLYPALNIYDSLYQKLLRYEGVETTTNYVRNVFAMHPTSKLAAILIDLQNDKTTGSPEAKHTAEQMKSLLLKYNDKLALYKCGCCNFKSKTFFWQCPACYSWESISPNNQES